MDKQSVSLNNTLKNLRTQYQRNSQQMNKMRAEYEESVDKRLDELRNEFNRIILEDEQKVRNSYEEEFRIYSDKVASQLQTGLESINSEYKKLSDENDRLKSEFKELESQLSGRINYIDENLRQKDESAKEEASKRMEQAYNTFAKFSQTYPHEFFIPHIADSLVMRMESAKSDFRSGFYEACMAVSSQVLFNISMLESEIDQKFDEWKKYFRQLEAFVMNISDFIYSDSFRTIKNENFEKELFVNSRMTDTLDYWSEGDYSELSEKVSSLKAFIDSVYSAPGNTRDEIIINTLKKTQLSEPLSVCDIENRLRLANELHKKACNIMTFIHTSFTASYMRIIRLGRNIITHLTSVRNCAIEFKGFRDSDLRKEYIIKASEPGSEINIRIFPVSPDRITVVNSVGMYIEHIGSGTPENYRASDSLLSRQITEVTHMTAVFMQNNCDDPKNDEEKAFTNIMHSADEKRKKELNMQGRVK